MDPITIALLAGGVSALAKGTAGYFQTRRANRLASQNSLNNQPVIKELEQNLTASKRLAAEGMPEQSYRAQQDAINRNLAYGSRTLQTGRNQAGNVANITANANRANQNLNAVDAQARQAGEQRVLSAREIIARAKQRSYEQNAMAIAALRGAGMQNMAGALDNIGGMSSMALQGMLGGGLPTGSEATTTTTPSYSQNYTGSPQWMPGSINQIKPRK